MTGRPARELRVGRAGVTTVHSGCKNLATALTLRAYAAESDMTRRIWAAPGRLEEDTDATRQAATESEGTRRLLPSPDFVTDLAAALSRHLS